MRPWSSSEHQEPCRSFVTNCRHFYRHKYYSLTVWLHLKWSICNFPPTSREQGRQCWSDPGPSNSFALTCRSCPGEFVPAIESILQSSDKHGAGHLCLAALQRKHVLETGALYTELSQAFRSRCCPDYPSSPAPPGQHGGEGFESCKE